MATDDAHPTRERRDLFSLAVLQIASGLFLIVTGFLVLRGDMKAMGWFAFHPPLVALALVSFLLGTVPLQPPPPNQTVRSQRFSIHQNLLLYFSLPCLTLGTWAIYHNKNVRSSAHFTSWHGTFGLITVLWFWSQAGMGLMTVWNGGQLFGGEAKAKAFYKYHRLSGYFLVPTALFTAHLAGGHSNWAHAQPYALLRFATYYVALPLMWLGLLFRLRSSKIPFPWVKEISERLGPKQNVAI